MPNRLSLFQYHPSASSVDRACQIAKQLFQHSRGNHDTDAATVRTIARRAQLTPAEIRQLLQPSRRPKDVRLGVWQRLVTAYRRFLARELAALEDEIARLEHLEPDDAALQDLLRKARALCGEIETALPPQSEE